jgi:hypothetical protein
MSLPNIKISRVNGQLNLSPGNPDTVIGMVLAGSNQNWDFYAPIQLFHESDLWAYGDGSGNDIMASDPLVYWSVHNFYEQAGDGAEMNLMVIPGTVNSNPLGFTSGVPNDLSNYPVPLDVLSDYDTATYTGTSPYKIANGKRLLLQAFLDNPQGLNGRCTVLLINTDVNFVSSLSAPGTLTQVIAATCPRFHDIALAYDNGNKPLIIGLPALGLDSTTIPSWNDVIPQYSDYVFYMATGDEITPTFIHVDMSLLAARMYNYQVCRSIARVAGGAVTTSPAYFPDGNTVESAIANWDGINDFKLIFYRTFTGLAGYYFSDDPTFTINTSDYGGIALNRVINKAKRIAYQTLLQKLNDDIQLDPVTGLIETGVLSDWESDVINAISASMLKKPSYWPSNKEWVKEISGVTCTIDPNSDIANGQVSAAIRIQRKGIAKQFNVSIGYTSTSGGA